MSHAASLYVKWLKLDANGQRITAQQRALLCYLADAHNEEMGGIAWPSVNTLGEYLSLSPRSTRRIIAQLERKGVLGRIPHLRDNGTNMSNNYYFPALGPAPARIERGGAKASGTSLLKKCGKDLKKSGKVVEKAVKKTRGTLTPVSPSPGHLCQGEGDTSDRGSLSPVSPLEPLIKTTNETTRETPVPPLPPQGGGIDDADSHFSSNSVRVQGEAVATRPPAHPLAARATRWDAFKAELLRRLQKLPDRLKADAVECYRDGIEHTTLLEEETDEQGVEALWTIGSTDPPRTQRSLTLLRQNVLAALLVTAKGRVQLRVFGAEGGTA